MSDCAQFISWLGGALVSGWAFGFGLRAFQRFIFRAVY